MKFETRTLKERLAQFENSISHKAWKLSPKEKDKGQDFRFYQFQKILGESISIIDHYKREKLSIDLGQPSIRTSMKGVQHITWYRPDLKIEISICWFAGSKTRNFRGFKVFWPYPSKDSEKKHFEIPSGLHNAESDLPAKVQIEIAQREMARWILSADAFQGYPKTKVFISGRVQ
tara:strand:- start:3995 stop:4519 length:525 start_codon:yes stop_codon:yes gene_type:complete